MPREVMEDAAKAVQQPLAHTQLDAEQLRIAQDAAYLAGKAAMQQVATLSAGAAGQAVAEAVVAGWHLAVERLSSVAAPSTPAL